MKTTKCPVTEKRGKKSEKREEERKRKGKDKTAVSLLNPKTSRYVSTGTKTFRLSMIFHFNSNQFLDTETR